MYELQPVFECVISLICSIVRYFTAFTIFKVDKYFMFLAITIGSMRLILALIYLYNFSFN